MGAGVDVARSTGHPVGVFLALKEIRRTRVRFGLLAGAVGLLVFLILFQQALLTGLVNQFIGALRNQSADVLVYNDQARKNLEGSIILPDQQAAIPMVEGVKAAAPLGEATFTVTAGGDERDAVLFGYVLGSPGAPTTLVDGRLPEGPGEGVASEKDRADGFDVGDVVQVQPDGVEITVVGIARDINYSVSPVLFVDTATFEAAKKVLRRNGYAGLSTRDVAAEAGVPLSQIHYHFGSKQGMVLALFEQCQLGSRRRIRRWRSGRRRWRLNHAQHPVLDRQRQLLLGRFCYGC